MDLSYSSSELSGFSDVESHKKRPKNVKSVVTRPKVTKPNPKKKSSDRIQKSSDVVVTQEKSSDGVFDISKLSAQNIESLRAALGIENTATSVPQEDELFYDNNECPEWENLHVEVENENIDFTDALFGGDNENLIENSKSDFDVWDLPKLKAPQKGKAVAPMLAELINTACTSSCDIDGYSEKYKVPQNCEKVAPPAVNQEVWKLLNKHAHLQDKNFVDIQNLVSMGIAPIVRLAELLKEQIGKTPEITRAVGGTARSTILNA